MFSIIQNNKKMNKLQKLQQSLKDLFVNNIEKFNPNQASNILDILMNGKHKKLE